MAPHRIARRWTAAAAFTAGVAVLIASVSPANASATSPADLRSQLGNAVRTPAAQQVGQGLGTLVTDPAVVALAGELLQNAAGQLTGFQKAYLKALQDAAPYAPVIAAQLRGESLTTDQQQRLNQLGSSLHNNPAIQRMISAGATLKDSPDLPGDVAAVVANNTAPAPGPVPGTFGHPYLEALAGDVASVRDSPAFQTYASAMAPLLRDPNYVPVLQGQQPATVTAYLPVPVFQALLLPNDRDPALLDWVKDGLEITGGIAAIVAAVALAPEELTAAAIIGVGAAVFAGLSALGIGLIDTYNDIEKAEDCDNDGDPGDPSDVPGIEC